MKRRKTNTIAVNEKTCIESTGKDILLQKEKMESQMKRKKVEKQRKEIGKEDSKILQEENKKKHEMKK